MGKRKSVLFLYPAIGSRDPYGFQAGLAALMGAVRAAGHDVDTLPLFDQGDLTRLDDRAAGAPDVVGIYTVYSQVPHLAEVIDRARGNGAPYVVCGGPHATLRPREVLAVPGVDAVVRGEADRVLPVLLEAGSDARLPGVVRRGDDPDTAGVAEPPRDLDELPLPYRPHEEFARVLARNDGVARFVFTRGCPYPCTYCCNHALRRLYGEPYVRFRSPDLALSEIAATVRAFDVRWVHLDDDILATNRRWLDAFLARYPREIGLPFSCNLRATGVNRELFAALRDAGCRRVTMGVETGDEDLARRVLRRNVTNSQLADAFAWAQEAGLETIALNMVGLPEETEEGFEKTLALNRRLRPTGAEIYVFTPYPGTEARELCESRGWIGAEASGVAAERTRSELAMPQFPPAAIAACRDRFQATWRRRLPRADEPLRLGFVSEEFPPFHGGGVGSYVFQVSRALAARGHEVHVFTRAHGDDDFSADPPGVIVHRVALPERPTLADLGWGDRAFAVHQWTRAATALSRLLLDETRDRPLDLVEFPEWTAPGLPALLSPDWETPSVVNFHTPMRVLQATNDQPALVGQDIEILAACLADARCAPSAFMADWANANLDLPDAVRVLRHPTDCSAVAADYAPPSGRTILFVGRLEPRKGVLELADALPAVLARFPDATVRLVGRDTRQAPDGGSVKDFVLAKLPEPLRARVEFVGNLGPSDLYAEYRRALFCVFPSRFENFPNVCLEAMSAGRTTVVTQSTGMGEMLGDAGVIVEDRDPAALAGAMIELLADPDRCDRLGRAAFARVRAEFAPDKVAGEREAFYREVIETFPQPTLARRLARVPISVWRDNAPTLAALVHDALGFSASVRPAAPDGARRLRDALADARAAGWGSVALYGAGRHTRRLLDRAWDLGPHAAMIRAVLDDAADGDVAGIPVVRPADAIGLGVDGIILSSDAAEDLLWERSGPLRSAGLPVVRLYGRLTGAR